VGWDPYLFTFYNASLRDEIHCITPDAPKNRLCVTMVEDVQQLCRRGLLRMSYQGNRDDTTLRTRRLALEGSLTGSMTELTAEGASESPTSLPGKHRERYIELAHRMSLHPMAAPAASSTGARTASSSRIVARSCWTFPVHAITQIWVYASSNACRMWGRLGKTVASQKAPAHKSPLPRCSGCLLAPGGGISGTAPNRLSLQSARGP